MGLCKDKPGAPVTAPVENWVSEKEIPKPPEPTVARES
jgi:hypothetical protein